MNVYLTKFGLILTGIGMVVGGLWSPTHDITVAIRHPEALVYFGIMDTIVLIVNVTVVVGGFYVFNIGRDIEIPDTPVLNHTPYDEDEEEIDKFSQVGIRRMG